jgi:biotin synthase
MIRVAVGTASVLGLTDIKMKAIPTTAHFLTPGRCTFDCKFCTQAKSSNADTKLLSRISWPEFNEKIVLSALKEKQDEFKRVCLQVVHSGEQDNYLRFVKDISAAIDIPLSVDLKANDIEVVRKTFDFGADVVGLPIDCANPRIYSKVKEGSFLSQLYLIKQAALEFKKRISTHLIIGLGESEKDAVGLIKKMHELDVNLGLFAFTPIKGTLLENEKPPTLDQYRRIQLARYLVYNNMDFNFKYDDEGNIMSFGAKEEDIENIIDSSAFQTTGCAGCNRPFYNESPGKALYNYPYTPSNEEYKKAINEAYCQLEGGNG